MDEEQGRDGIGRQRRSCWSRRMSWIHSIQRGREELELVGEGRLLCCYQGSHKGTNNHLVEEGSIHMVQELAEQANRCYSGSKDAFPDEEQPRKAYTHPPSSQPRPGIRPRRTTRAKRSMPGISWDNLYGEALDVEGKGG